MYLYTYLKLTFINSKIHILTALFDITDVLFVFFQELYEHFSIEEFFHDYADARMSQVANILCPSQSGCDNVAYAKLTDTS